MEPQRLVAEETSQSKARGREDGAGAEEQGDADAEASPSQPSPAAGGGQGGGGFEEERLCRDAGEVGDRQRGDQQNARVLAEQAEHRQPAAGKRATDAE